MNNKFGIFLETLRGKTPLRTVAEKAGLSHTYIRDLELGINRKTKKMVIPSIETLEKLARAYDYPIDDLIDKSGYTELLNEVSEGYRRKHELEKGLDESFYWWCKLITDKDGQFYNFVEADIQELEERYELAGTNQIHEIQSIDFDTEKFVFSYPSSSLWHAVTYKNDISLKAKIVDEIIRICEKYNEYTHVLRSSDNTKQQLDLAEFLKQKGITYNGITLENTDYKVLTGMINAYFQNR
ncbi:helix-turn-helix transcriptional regulator [Paenibacillus anseongense]|uniref:helix-turn-helix domain-containing protein n=1 Tax=Paenibacillus anseongense TaxID=2682845 RepID=UPI002DBC1494|nr:helix-turn-helix transcriptional regulator [Paenibacillus anseongense]MEC0266697.1 helix-turn-helix transcriptional regulator [Paenibacillus anseongense]